MYVTYAVLAFAELTSRMEVTNRFSDDCEGGMRDEPREGLHRRIIIWETTCTL